MNRVTVVVDGVPVSHRHPGVVLFAPEAANAIAAELNRAFPG